jgi:hypothetical protein
MAKANSNSNKVTLAPPTVWEDVDMDLWADVVLTFDPKSVVEFVGVDSVMLNNKGLASTKGVGLVRSRNVYQVGGSRNGCYLGFMLEWWVEGEVVGYQPRLNGGEPDWDLGDNGWFATREEALFEFPWVKTSVNEAYVLRLAKMRADEIMSGKDREPVPTDEQIIKAANDLLFGVPSFQAVYGDWGKHRHNAKLTKEDVKQWPTMAMSPETMTPEDALGLMLQRASLLKYWATKLEEVLESRLR